MMNALLILIALQSVLSFESVCPKLQVSSDILVIKDDIVRDGIPIEKWNKNSGNPVIVSSSTMIDYLYITVEGSREKLDLEAFILDFDDHIFANTSLAISNKHVAKNEGLFTLEIKYRCKEYGGALIDYELKISVPDCGQTHIFWKKICGNPLVPRGGLSMDVAYKQYNQTIVKNGLLINASYFDQDLDNFVFQVPSNTLQTKFYLYMDLPQMSVDNQLVQITQADDKFEEDKQLLEAYLKMVPEVSIQAPIIDADTSKINPQMSGQLAGGGKITETPQSIIITFNCLEKGETIIELSIPLDYFRDLNLVFIKKCFTESSYFFGSGKSGLFLWSLIFFFLFEVFGTLYNTQVKGLKGQDAVPCSGMFINLFQRIQSLKKQRYSSRQDRFPYKSTDEEEYESDFKVERADDSNKYGSI